VNAINISSHLANNGKTKYISSQLLKNNTDGEEFFLAFTSLLSPQNKSHQIPKGKIQTKQETKTLLIKTLPWLVCFRFRGYGSVTCTS